MGAGELARAPLSKLFLPVVLVVSNLKTFLAKVRDFYVGPLEITRTIWYNTFQFFAPKGEFNDAEM